MLPTSPKWGEGKENYINTRLGNIPLPHLLLPHQQGFRVITVGLELKEVHDTKSMEGGVIKKAQGQQGKQKQGQ